MLKYLLVGLLAISAFGQSSQPVPLYNAWIPSIRATTIIDNRSIVNRQLTYVSIGCEGSGSWSVDLEYSSTSTGSWTSFGDGATVDNTSTVAVAFGFLYLYPNFVRVHVVSGSPTCNFSGFNKLFPQNPESTVSGVSSFNARTGVVIPVINDYSFSLISGVATNAQTTATSANTASAIVARDGSGNFTAGTITANLTGNASTATSPPPDATYITQTPNSNLSAEQALSLLGTGMVKNTTTTGVLSIGTAGTDYSKPNTSETTSGDRTFTGFIDGSGATTTKPMKSGTSLPATCSVGEQFFKTNATAGQNLYGCTATNTWTLQAGGGGGVSCAPVSPATTTTYDASAVAAGANACFTVALSSTTISTNTITWPSSGSNQHLLFLTTQDGTGGRAWPCPTGVSGCPVVFDTTASGVQSLEIVYGGSSAGQVIAINGQSTAATCQYFFEASGNGNNYEKICAPSSLGGDTTATMPGVAGTVLVNTGSPADGDCAKYVVSGGLINLTTNGSACSAGGGASFDRTKVGGSALGITDEMFPVGNFIQTGNGQLGWIKAGTGSESNLAGTSNHPGLLQIQTGTTASDTIHWVLDTENVGAINLTNRLDASCGCTSWDQTIIIGTDTLTPSITSTTFQIGWTATTAMLPNNSIVVRYSDQSLTCTNGDANSTANFMLEVIDNSGVTRCANTGVAVASNTYYSIRLYSTTLGTIGAQVSTSGGGYSSAVTVSAGIPSVSLRPIFSIETHNTTGKRLIEDLWHLEMSGLTR